MPNPLNSSFGNAAIDHILNNIYHLWMHGVISLAMWRNEIPSTLPPWKSDCYEG